MALNGSKKSRHSADPISFRRYSAKWRAGAPTCRSVGISASWFWTGASTNPPSMSTVPRCGTGSIRTAVGLDRGVELSEMGVDDVAAEVECEAVLVM